MGELLVGGEVTWGLGASQGDYWGSTRLDARHSLLSNQRQSSTGVGLGAASDHNLGHAAVFVGGEAKAPCTLDATWDAGCEKMEPVPILLLVASCIA